MTVDLSGTRILDLSRVLAGPFATNILAGLGADVVKVELPSGDPARAIGPHFDDRSLYFSSVNSGKRSVVVDPASGDDRDMLEDLLGWADAVIHNFRGEAALSLDVAPLQLLGRHPDLVVVTISGYHSSTSEGARPAFDLTIQAEAGVMSVTGEVGGPPVRCGVPLSDLAGGMWAALAVSTGLLTRTKTGRGLHVEVPLLDATLPFLSYMATTALATDADPPPVGSGHHSVVPYRAYPTADGHVVIAVLAEKFWSLLCGALELGDLAEREDLASGAGRLAARREVDARIEEACLRWSTDEVIARLDDAGVPASRVNSVIEALTTDYVRQRGLVEEIAAPEGDYSTLRGPFDPPAPVSPAPALGEHTGAVRGELGRIRAQRGEDREPEPEG